MPYPELRLDPSELFTPAASKKHPDADRIVADLSNQLSRRGIELYPIAWEIFTDKLFLDALPPEIRENPEQLALYAEHTGKLFDLLPRGGFYGERLTLPRTGENGRIHEPDEGPRILLGVLRELGCDPNYVLMFRLTQPSAEPKPEAFWTTDFFETQRGLSQEIFGDRRKSAVTLISTLATVAGEGGVIRDINDDGGLAVRQIDPQPFDQKKAIAVFSPEE
ncbi:MAG: hypothetical protein V1716_05810 [Candidatus Uhrbacteria bacterium]